ncbi:MAG: SRPBCC family protein [Chloroflexota bacterium]
MVKLQRAITIHAPVDRVFAYMNDPCNLPEIWPSMVEVKDVKPNPKGGHDFGWVYKMAGMRFDGASEMVEYEANRRMATQSTKGIESRFAWTFETVDGDTRLSVEIEYNVPIPLLGRLTEALIVKQNEHEAATLLENLKSRMEVGTRVEA